MHAARVGGEPRLFERQCAGGTQSPGLANSSKALLTAFVDQLLINIIDLLKYETFSQREY